MPERERGNRNQEVIAEFRANGGKVGGYFAGISLLLLTTTGAKSSRPHTTPLSYLADGGRYIVVAAAGGAPASSDWYHNLIANPGVTVETGTEVFEATAVITTGEERSCSKGSPPFCLSWWSTRTESPARSPWSPSAGERTPGRLGQERGRKVLSRQNARPGRQNR